VFGSARPLLTLAGISTGFRFHLTPENIMGNTSRFLDLAARFVEKRLEFRRVG
jgi:hypothetical protein